MSSEAYNHDVNMSKIFTNIQFISQLIASIIIIIYGLGFLTWNLYLSQFGFFESDALQARYILTGITMILLCSPVILVLFFLHRPYGKSNIPDNEYRLFSIIVMWILLFTIFLGVTYRLFPTIPQHWGGSLPFIKSLLADTEKIEYLSQLDIPWAANGEGKESIQTDFLCEIYSNDKYIIIGTGVKTEPALRVVILKKEIFNGFQVLPTSLSKRVRKDKCSPFIGVFLE